MSLMKILDYLLLKGILFIKAVNEVLKINKRINSRNLMKSQRFKRRKY